MTPALGSLVWCTPLGWWSGLWKTGCHFSKVRHSFNSGSKSDQSFEFHCHLLSFPAFSCQFQSHFQYPGPARSLKFSWLSAASKCHELDQCCPSFSEHQNFLSGTGWESAWLCWGAFSKSFASYSCWGTPWCLGRVSRIHSSHPSGPLPRSP